MIMCASSRTFGRCAALLFVTAILSLVVISAFAQSPGLQQAEHIKHSRISLDGLNDAGNARFIVKYRAASAVGRDHATLSARLQVVTSSHNHSSLAVKLAHHRRMATGDDVILASRLLNRFESERLMHQIAADPDVEYVEVDRLYKPAIAQADPLYPEQWALSSPFGIDVEEAWELASGDGVVVAVLDTGITRHSDLNANILPGYDLVSHLIMANDGDGWDADPIDPGDWETANLCGTESAARDSSWHGTLVAGIVAAVANNETGIAGVAHRAKVVPVRIAGPCGAWGSDIADGIAWASGGGLNGVPLNENPAEVINISLGSSDFGTCAASMQTAINDAVFRGTTIVVAAGNEDADVETGLAPAGCRNVITVGATDSAGERVSYSNYGSAVDIAAPGSSIVTTSNTGATAPREEAYMAFSGTSMSTPLVAGIVALVQSAAPKPLAPAEVEALLKRNVTFFPKTPSEPIGPGIVNAGRALREATRPSFKRSVYQVVLF